MVKIKTLVDDLIEHFKISRKDRDALELTLLQCLIYDNWINLESLFKTNLSADNKITLIKQYRNGNYEKLFKNFCFYLSKK